jgi:catechol 2,3-dioxygenase-like lactoylglutathione lyase family enzyme
VGGPRSREHFYQDGVDWTRCSQKKREDGRSVKKYFTMMVVFGVVFSLWGQSVRKDRVTMSELHFNVPNVEASKKFWVNLGGQAGATNTVNFPGVRIFLKATLPGEPVPSSSAGSIVNHVGFQVVNLADAMARWKAAGLNTVPGQKPGQGYVYTPDGLMRVEIVEKPSLAVPISFHHIHFLVGKSDGGIDSVGEMKSWYVKIFDAKPGKRGAFEAADLPGTNLTFSQSPAPVVGTKGRFLDHIGFEVVDLRLLCERLKTQGLKFDVPYKVLPGGAGAAFLTDPWGTYIELSERPSVDD